MIDKIGVEIECGVEPVDGGAPSFEAFDYTRDGSVETGTGIKSAEYVSDPFPWPEQEDEMADAVETVYAHIGEINSSMGLHVHASLQNDYYYYALSSQRFHDWFMDRLASHDLYDDYDRLRQRMSGGNGSHYCKPIQTPNRIDEMLRGRGGRSEKYRAISYQKGKYDTMEFRIFCAMEYAEDVMAAVRLVADSIETWLDNGHHTDTVTDTADLPHATDNGVTEVDTKKLKRKPGTPDKEGRKLVDAVERLVDNRGSIYL